MEQDHLPIVLPVLDRMRLSPEDNVLDVGCGAGWLSRLLAEQVPEGRVVGVDISDEMIRRARRNSADLENAMLSSARRKRFLGTLTSSIMRFPSKPPIIGPIPSQLCAKFTAFCAKLARLGCSSTTTAKTCTRISGAKF
jgi:SAM-dependent methyltransferase